MKERGIIVTNHHVVDSFRQVAVENEHKERALARVVMINPHTDIAILKADNYFNADGIKINQQVKVNSQDQVFVHGYPFGMPYTVTEGIISSPEQLVDGRKLVQTDAAVNPGNSGGPMLNVNEELIAVTSSKFTNADNMGFGIPLTTLLEDITSFEQIQDFNLFYFKCNSCGTLIAQKSEYCSNCGNEINAKGFFELDKESKSFVSNFVEEALKMVNINPILARTGPDFWEFHHGTSLIRIFIFNNDYLYATSPLNELPKQNLEELMKYLLSNTVMPYKLGIYKNIIYLSYRVSITDLHTSYADTIKSNLAKMLTKADELDNLFAEKFQCPFTSFSKIVQQNL